MSADGALYGGLGDGVGAGVAEAEEDLSGTLRFAGLKEGDRVLERLHPKIVFLPGTLHTIEKGGEVDELAAGVHESQVDEIHGLRRSPCGHAES
jgi:hypothetical protein